MPNETRRRGGGAKLARSETVTVRLDPKLNYLCELAARAQRRTRSSFIEWAVENSLRSVALKQRTADGGISELTLADLVESLWNVEEWERVARLATYTPELLSIEEQKWWSIASDESWLWKKSSGPRTLENIDRKVFRRSWEDIKAVASGQMTELELNKTAALRA